MSASHPPDVLEIALLVCVLFASLLLMFVSQGLEAVLARRMFTIINLIVAIFLSFHVDSTHVAKYVLSIVGPWFVNAALLSVRRVTTSSSETLRKRHE